MYGQVSSKSTLMKSFVARVLDDAVKQRERHMDPSPLSRHFRRQSGFPRNGFNLTPIPGEGLRANVGRFSMDEWRHTS